MSNTSRALINAAGSEAQLNTKYTTKRIHRKLDSRDTLLRAALYNLENKSMAEWPVITKLSSGAEVVFNSAADASGLTITGKNLTNGATTSYVKLFEGTDYEMYFEAVLPGEQTFTVKVTSSGASNGTIVWTYAAGVLTATCGIATQADALAADAAADAVAKYYIRAGQTTARGTTDAVSDTTALDGTVLASDESAAMDNGSGELFTLTIGGEAIEPDGSAARGISAFSETGAGVTTIVFDYDTNAHGQLAQHDYVQLIATANGVACDPIAFYVA